MGIKKKKKCLHLDDLGLLGLIWWEDIFTAINPSSTHRNLTTMKYLNTYPAQFKVYHNKLRHKIKQEGQKCPKRRVAQAAITLLTAVIKFRNKERNVRSPS